MPFSSISFLYFFLPVTGLLYLAMPRRGKNLLLLLVSLLFYAWGEQTFVLLFAGAIAVGWVFGLLIERYRGTLRANILAGVSIGISLAFLCCFKYADFFLSGVNGLIGSDFPLPGLALPIGISFFTFQIISYTVDVARGSVPAQRNLVHFGTYVSFFPQLIAGPIVRYQDILWQLTHRKHSLSGVALGIRRFILGLSKKVLLANGLAELCAHFRASTESSVLFFWLYAIAFTLEIYFDFSGYSDMAIGLGQVFGFRLPENFNYPYISRSITEFWRRWHMTLGSWFRDYVYIPLGGNRRGVPRQIFNLLVVWMLTGLWHGAAWNFVLWGLLYGVLLALEKWFLGPILTRHKVLGHVYVLLAVTLGFVLFNGASLGQVTGDLAGLFGLNGVPLVTGEALYYLRSYLVLLVLGMVGATPLPVKLMGRLSNARNGAKWVNLAEPVALSVLLVMSTACLVDGSFNPFLYFRF